VAGGYEKIRFAGDEMRMQTWRRTELFTADARSDDHSQPRRQAVKRSVKVATALLLCSCGGSFQVVSRSTFNPSVVAGCCWSL